MSSGAKKLKIVRGQTSGMSVRFDESEGQVLNLPFNPTEYSIEKKNNFAQAVVPGLDSPVIQYGSGDARTLSLEVLLDTYTTENQQDLRAAYLDQIDKLLEVDGDLHAPPLCKVIWGSLQFVGVLEDAKKQFVLFLDDGTPVRARVSLSFKEYVPVDVQVRAAPRSSPDRYKRRVIQDGEQLWHIAEEAYGEPSQWRLLAEANRIDDPLRLRVGATLIVPILEPATGGTHGT
jgi:hypothetical protein